MNERTNLDVRPWILLLAATFFVPELAAQDEKGSAKTASTAAGDPAEQVPAEDKPTHDALIALRDRILKKYDSKDIDGVLAELDEDVVATWQDGTVSRSPKAVRDYYDEKIGRPESIVKELTTKCVIDRYSRLYNDRSTAVVDGRLEQDFLLRDGKRFQLTSPWTASVVKRGDQWKIASFHVSANMFDNGVLDLFIQQNRLWTGIIAGVGGLVVGLLAGLVFGGRGRKKGAAAV